MVLLTSLIFTLVVLQLLLLLGSSSTMVQFQRPSCRHPWSRHICIHQDSSAKNLHNTQHFGWGSNQSCHYLDDSTWRKQDNLFYHLDTGYFRHCRKSCSLWAVLTGSSTTSSAQKKSLKVRSTQGHIYHLHVDIKCDYKVFPVFLIFQLVAEKI